MSTEHKPVRAEPARNHAKPVLRPVERDGYGRAGWALAITRLSVGFVFLWAFLDKTFGLGYATPSDRAWINGGEPTAGFLGGLQSGPLREMFQGWAGAGWADWLFMLGLLGVGLAAMLGISLRIAAVSGSLMMLLMWLAEWPLARLAANGDATMSTNPVVDYHIIYALALIVCAALYAGHTWGFGRMWERIRFVGRNRWLL